MPDIEVEFAARLRQARKDHDMTLAQVSDLLHGTYGIEIDPSGIMRLEKGTRSPRFAEAAALADILGIRIWDLIQAPWFMTFDPDELKVQATQLEVEIRELNAKLARAEIDLQDARRAAVELRELRDRAEARLAAITRPPADSGEPDGEDTGP